MFHRSQTTEAAMETGQYSTAPTLAILCRATTVGLARARPTWTECARVRRLPSATADAREGHMDLTGAEAGQRHRRQVPARVGGRVRST